MIINNFSFDFINIFIYYIILNTDMKKIKLNFLFNFNYFKVCEIIF